MEISEIVQLLKDERDRIDAALDALQGLTGPKHRRRVLSAAVRRKMSESHKKRWVALKKKKKK